MRMGLSITCSEESQLILETEVWWLSGYHHLVSSRVKIQTQICCP